ncbi:hypothetical protein DFA_06576 [Cavenderia fasciculata]|uniref:N-alpha-acetyltransferase 60 n=1 Tax=Cavenderia fasciculata TaxID=261658 RepID=F4PJE0_CACFS|nr:uncharacterized protein DFA_06576 [Cavenderia fasciculata]EGG24426.1 hypothetical protein DFA_06576 [Cavenderia fasciculata]|eukprot:XP_004362277.1 hypothetical protein DFA_06576 [Cavenderia fasciculata]
MSSGQSAVGSIYYFETEVRLFQLLVDKGVWLPFYVFSTTSITITFLCYSYCHKTNNNNNSNNNNNNNAYSGNNNSTINNSNNNNIIYRPFKRTDLPSLRTLQLQLFPVKYRSSFYQKLIRNDFICILAFRCTSSSSSLNNQSDINKIDNDDGIDNSSCSSGSDQDDNDNNDNNNNNNNNNIDVQTYATPPSSPTTTTTTTTTNNQEEEEEEEEERDKESTITIKEELIGVVCSKISSNEGICSLFMSHYTGYILTLGVKEEYRKLGIGSVLLNTMCEYLYDRQCEIVSLHVKFGNVAAFQFYQRNGFSIEEEIVDYYLIDSVKHNALKMTKEVVKPKSKLSWLNWFNQLSLADNNNNNNNTNNNNDNTNINETNNNNNNESRRDFEP